MKCVIPGSGIKAFGKAVFCLSKIGEELYIEGQDKGLALKTVNTARSAYSCFLFDKKFFLSYRDTVSSGRGHSSQEHNSLKCKIPARSFLAVFKSLHTLERTVDRCIINLDLSDNKLVFVFHCTHGVVKTHRLGYQECEPLQAVFSKEVSPNHISAPAKVLSEVVTHFPGTLEEVTLTAQPALVRLRNYVEDDGDGGRHSLTEICLASDEFNHYQVSEDVSVTFCLKELRAILMFTDAVSHSLALRFDEPGRPIVLSVEDGKNYSADFVLATLLDSNSTAATSHNQTSTANGIAAPDHMTTDTSTTNDLRPLTPSTPPRPKPRKTKQKNPSLSEVEFPTGSQFNKQAALVQNSTRVTSNVHVVPPAPTDTDFMEIEYSEVAKGNEATEIDQLFGGERVEQAPVHTAGGPDEFDVMDAIFGDENLTDVADNIDQFGLGVEGHVGKGVSPKRSHDYSEVDTTTQDSIINDSGFLPRSPPAKKHKGSYQALFGMNLFRGGQDELSEVLAPDSDEEQ